MLKNFIGLLFISICAYSLTLVIGGCAQISQPSGGPKDTIAPVLINAAPANLATNFTGNKIVLTFDEYIEVSNISENVLISPLQKSNPIISFKFRAVTIKFRDTLLPNTTYTIDFGKALQDLNEGNPLQDFTYTFSTGDVIDSLSLNGKVLLAESGKTDSTLTATLYRDLSDTAVQKKRPLYTAKVKADGSFSFKNLPAGQFKLYALKDGDGGKTYNAKTETFAFLDSIIDIEENTTPRTLYAYQETKAVPPPVGGTRTPAEKRLRYTTSLEAQVQDVTRPLEIIFNNSIRTFDEKSIVLLDSNRVPVANRTFTPDSTQKIWSLSTSWLQDYDYALVIPKDAVSDSVGSNLFRTDTIRFNTSKAEDYGSIVLRFKNIDLNKNPVIQFVSAETVKFSFPVTGNEWSGKMFKPGEYELRILYDTDKNGRWDPGSYATKRQPEIAITIPQKITVRANWDNELDINL